MICSLKRLFRFLRLQPGNLLGVVFLLLCICHGIQHHADNLSLVLYQLLKLLCQNSIQLRGANGRQIAARFPVFTVHLTFPELRFSLLRLEGLPVKGRSMLSADDLAAIRIPALIPYTIGFRTSAPLLKKSVGLIPYFFRHDGRNIRVGIGYPFTFVEEQRFLLAVVQRLGLVAAIPALIFGILQNVSDGACVEHITLQAGVTTAGQLL